MSETKEHKEIELRSEEVQEVLGRIPSWIERWGITLLFGIVVVLLIGSCFFKYPETITAEMTLTGANPAAQLVARSTGKISGIFVADGDTVTKNSLLAIIENPASTEDVLFLDTILKIYGNMPDTLETLFEHRTDWRLGDVQSTFVPFLSTLHEYGNYKELDYYPKKIAVLQERIAKYRKYSQGIVRQKDISQKQYQIAEGEYMRDSTLYRRGVISASDHEAAKSTLLGNRSSLESSKNTLEEIGIQIGQLKENLLDLELEQVEKETVLQQNYRSALEQLQNAVQAWKLAYCLISPIDGCITFTSYWSENQSVSTGGNVFTVIPTKKEQLVGKAKLPSARSGKVRIGQRVIVHFTNYPDSEFGVVNGTVKNISQVPAENNYMVEIDFPNGLQTTYKKALPTSYEMTATAEVVTEDLRVIARLIMPIKDLIKNN